MQQIAFQGEHGAYSQQAAYILFGEQIITVPKQTFAEVFHAVSSGETDAGIVPVVNSTAGPVAEVWDLLQKTAGVLVSGEIALPIHHCLLCLPGQTINDIRRIISHPQALAQCEAYLAPLREQGVLIEAAYDTAGSARQIREQELYGVAAIASASAAGLYGLLILARQIETFADNATQFVALRHQLSASPSPLWAQSVEEALATLTSHARGRQARGAARYGTP